jgi:tetratricopeptide (TPR) repeat protein
LLQNWQEAVADFSQALKLNPDNHFARYRRGTVYQMQGENASALDDYNALVQRGVKAFEVFFNRGLLLQAAGDWEGTYRDLQAAWQINPNHPQVQQQLALVLAASPVGTNEELRQAEQLARNACQQVPEDHEAQEILAIVLGAQGKFEEALRTLEADAAEPTLEDSPRRSQLIELFRRQERFKLKE